MPAPRVTIGARLAWTCVLAGFVLVIYGIAAMLGVAPVPRSARSLAQTHAVGHGYAIVTGYLVIPSGFVSIGSSLPPYALAENIGEADPAARVAPRLADVSSGRVTMLVDLSTGDGSKYSPYYVRALGSAAAVAGALVFGAIVVLALLFWLAGFVVVVGRVRRARGTPRATA